MTTRLDVLIDADTRGVRSGVNDASDDFGRLGSVAKTAGLAIGAGLAVGATALVKFGADAIGAASDLNQTLSKSEVIFGRQAEMMREWSEGAAEAFGLSQQAALGYAAQLGDMFTQLGATGKESAATSQQVVQLAADLGAFNNLDTADVLDRIQAGFRGEYDSLQALIPNINALRVQKEALAESGKTLATELTGQEKVQAALNIIMEDGAKSAGAFAKEADSLAGTQQRLRANLEDVKAEIGQKLLPVATDFMLFLKDKAIPAAAEWGAKFEEKVGPAVRGTAKFINEDLMPALKDLGPEFKETAKVVGDTVEQVDALIESFGDLFGEIEDDEGGKVVAAFIGTHLKLLLGTVAAIAAQVGAATNALDALFRKIEEMPSLGPLGGLLGALNGGGGGGGGEASGETLFPSGTQRIVVEHKHDVELNNGIITDPVALGETIADAMTRTAIAVGS